MSEAEEIAAAATYIYNRRSRTDPGQDALKELNVGVLEPAGMILIVVGCLITLRDANTFRECKGMSASPAAKQLRLRMNGHGPAWSATQRA
jgi:hypothetical protein